MRLTLFQLIFWQLVSTLYFKYQTLTGTLVLNPAVKFEWFKINNPDFQQTARRLLVESVSVYVKLKLNSINITFYSLSHTVHPLVVNPQSLKLLHQLSQRIKELYKFLDCKWILQPQTNKDMLL
jgi:hypothetical protein